MNIALVGDSHTQVVWPLLASMLESQGHHIVLQRSQPGWDVKSYQKEGILGGQLASSRPDLVIYGLGGNNFELSDAYGARVAYIRSVTPRDFLWVGPAHAKDASVATRHDWTADYLKSNVSSFLDMRPYTQTGHRSDGVHFEPATYRNWARIVADKVAGMDRVKGVGKSRLPAKSPKTHRDRLLYWAVAGITIGALAFTAIRKH